MSQFWSDIVKNLTPYVPGEQPQNREYVKLNTNENPFAPSPKVIEAIDHFDRTLLKRYPDPEATKLRQSIADFYNKPLNQIFVGNGSDEVLAHSFFAFFKKAKPIAFPDITYSFYPVYANLYNIDAIEFPVQDDFSIDVNSISENTDGIILPNPNAPTSKYLEPAEIKTLLKKHPNKVVIIDEAYIDFGGESAVNLVDEFENLLVIQTFSKSRSLAGLRIGFAIGQPHLIEALQRVKNSFNSYPIDQLAIVAGQAAMQDVDYFQSCCDQVIQTRAWTHTQLQALGFECIESKANFILAKPLKHDAEKVYLDLKENGVLVRYFKDSKISDYLRISIDTQSNMKTLIDVLKSVL
ncbi:histidinol-phosphate transaminase [Marinicellulosiphila megalodicopiae]|uniref:histidinol-phosphate transaminase n=1 Tax=Marinicellulosiphila megalodicopiae TaxID=2724896 RepID=UPI003BAEA1CF